MLRLACLGIIAASFIAAQEIRIENPTIDTSKPTPVQGIVLDSNGRMVEKEYTYNPDTQTIIIDSGDEGTDASLFFPLFETRFLWWGGYWVDYDGNYWNGHWQHIDNDEWHDHWNNYWDNHWNEHWHNHWNQRKGQSNFRYQNQEHWNNRSFQGGQRNRGGGRGGGGRR